MRPLNRPMFRMGGPIKEGIMSGIQEPRQGYKKGKIVSSILNKIPGGQKIISGTKDIIPRTINKIKNFYKTPPSTSKDLVIYNAADAAKKNPAFLTNRYLFEKGIKPVAGGIYKTAKGVLPYAGVGTIAASGGLGIYNMLKDPKIDDDGISQINKTKAAIGMPENLTIRKDPGTSQLIADKINKDTKQTAEELRKKNVERYRDIMDIKGMNKDAAYNSLIAASQLINESGDFKGDIKSGRLINDIIQATSKQFDKPKATKDAIDTLILKGEIEKDLKASDPAAKLAAELTGKRIDVLNKQLAGDTLQDTVNAIYAKTGAFPSGSGLASVARTKGIDVKMVIKSEDINNYLEANPGKDAVDFMESQVLEATTAGTPVEPGAYVVKDRIVVIDSEGNVSPYL
jgi:hypothetical protein